MNGEERILNTKNILLDNETAYNLIYLSIATNYPDEWDIIKKIDRKIMDNKLMMSYSLLSMLNNNNDKYQQNIENNKDSFYDKDDKKMK